MMRIPLLLLLLSSITVAACGRYGPPIRRTTPPVGAAAPADERVQEPVCDDPDAKQTSEAEAPR